MKVVVAPDSFKGSLTSLQVAEAISLGIKKFDSTIEMEKIPLADGGEGTVKALVAATEGELVTKTVQDPQGREIESYFGILGADLKSRVEIVTEAVKLEEKLATADLAQAGGD